MGHPVISQEYALMQAEHGLRRLAFVVFNLFVPLAKPAETAPNSTDLFLTTSPPVTLPTTNAAMLLPEKPGYDPGNDYHAKQTVAQPKFDINFIAC